MGRLVLVLGGARSGKSRFAQQLAEERGGSAVLFVATAQASDEEMAARIRAHRLCRPAEWRTLEAPLRAAAAIREAGALAQVVLLDCLTLLISNILIAAGEDAAGAEEAIEEEIGALLALRQELPATIIVVSNEVGMGVVPPTPIGRLFRDLQGRANQRLAQQADEVYFLLAGVPLQLVPATARPR